MIRRLEYRAVSVVEFLGTTGRKSFGKGRLGQAVMHVDELRRHAVQTCLPTYILIKTCWSVHLLTFVCRQLLVVEPKWVGVESRAQVSNPDP